MHRPNFTTLYAILRNIKISKIRKSRKLLREKIKKLIYPPETMIKFDCSIVCKKESSFQEKETVVRWRPVFETFRVELEPHIP